MLNLSATPDINYLAQVVRIDNLIKHPKADRLQIATVCGCEVITGLNAKIGDLYIYLPIECVVDSHFLSWSNSYAAAERNADVKIKGYFPKNSRVKMVKLREVFSNGYIFPAAELERYIKETYNEPVNLSKFVDIVFDSLGDVRFVKKYVRNNQSGGASNKTKGAIKKYETKLVPGQFAFHEDTVNLRRNLSKIQPDDIIVIVNKYHGASGIVSKVLVKRQLTWKEKVAKWFGIKVVESEYGNLYSSRTVLKNARIGPQGGGFYDSDIWGIVSDRVYPLLDSGVSIYCEIFGFTPKGGGIQGKYDYGCKPGELDFIVYKATITLPDGKVYVMSHPQLVAYCQEKGFKMAETYYYGVAKNLFPDLDTETHWADNFTKKLEERFLEKKCHLCKNDVFSEGICIRKDVPFVWDCLKLKSLAFLFGESVSLDANEPNLEDEQPAE